MEQATEPSIRAELKGLADRYLARARRLEAAQGWPEELPERPAAAEPSTAAKREPE
jgi:hypothetical protein